MNRSKLTAIAAAIVMIVAAAPGNALELGTNNNGGPVQQQGQVVSTSDSQKDSQDLQQTGATDLDAPMPYCLSIPARHSLIQVCRTRRWVRMLGLSLGIAVTSEESEVSQAR